MCCEGALQHPQKIDNFTAAPHHLCMKAINHSLLSACRSVPFSGAGIFKAMAVLVCAGLCAACTSTQHIIDHEKMGSAWDGQSRTNLLVVGLYEDRTDRVSVESVLASQLTEMGIKASPSYALLPDLNADYASIQAAVHGKGYDAILTMATLEGGQQFDYESHQALYAFVRLLGSEGTFTRLGGYADQGVAAQHVLDIGLFDTPSFEPIWSATTASRESDIGPEGIKRLANWLAGELKARKLTN